MDKIIAAIIVAIGTVGFLLVIALVFSIPVWLLWNWLMPEIFSFKEISLLQACGLSFLSSLLFKSSSKNK